MRPTQLLATLVVAVAVVVVAVASMPGQAASLKQLAGDEIELQQQFQNDLDQYFWSVQKLAADSPDDTENVAAVKRDLKLVSLHFTKYLLARYTLERFSLAEGKHLLKVLAHVNGPERDLILSRTHVLGRYYAIQLTGIIWNRWLQAAARIIDSQVGNFDELISGMFDHHKDLLLAVESAERNLDTLESQLDLKIPLRDHLDQIIDDNMSPQKRQLLDIVLSSDDDEEESDDPNQISEGQAMLYNSLLEKYVPENVIDALVLIEQQQLDIMDWDQVSKQVLDTVNGHQARQFEANYP